MGCQQGFETLIANQNNHFCCLRPQEAAAVRDAALRRMADRAQPISIFAWCWTAAALPGGGGDPWYALVAVALACREPGQGLGSSDWAALRFTYAFKLRIVGCALAWCLPFRLQARIGPRRRFYWSDVYSLHFWALPFILPVIVAVLGLIEVFGRAGWVSEVCLHWWDYRPYRSTGLHGVVLAHVFFNLAIGHKP